MFEVILSAKNKKCLGKFAGEIMSVIAIVTFVTDFRVSL
jgi:hypothetical protein